MLKGHKEDVVIEFLIAAIPINGSLPTHQVCPTLSSSNCDMINFKCLVIAMIHMPRTPPGVKKFSLSVKGLTSSHPWQDCRGSLFCRSLASE